MYGKITSPHNKKVYAKDWTVCSHLKQKEKPKFVVFTTYNSEKLCSLCPIQGRTMSKTHLGHITIKAPLRFHVRDFDQQSAGWIIFFSVSYFFSLKIKKKNCIFLFFLVLFLLSFPFEKCQNAAKDDFSQGTACEVHICFSKYTTPFLKGEKISNPFESIYLWHILYDKK